MLLIVILIGLVIFALVYGQVSMMTPVESWSDRDLVKRRNYYSSQLSRRVASFDGTLEAMEKTKARFARLEAIDAEIRKREESRNFVGALAKTYSEVLSEDATSQKKD